MDLNSIKLAPADIVRFYKNTLVDIGPESEILPKTNSAWKYLGENKKKILVVVNYAEAVHIPDKQLSFLTKLLAACNLNMGDVAIFNFLGHKSAEFIEIINFFNPKVVLLFAVEPNDFGMPMIFPLFQVQGHKDAMFVASPSLEEIEPDKTLKSKLWVCLKKIFNL
jgi:hypothetical protein